MCAVTGLFATIGSYLAGTGGTAAAAGAGAAEAGATTAAVEAGGYAAVGGGIAAGAAPAAAAGVAGGGAVAGGGIATTVSEAAAVASGASALYTLSQGPGRINVPPVPVTQPAQVDQAVANAEQAQIARRAAAGGLQSTVGTGTGQAGAILNPATLSNRSMLGA